MIGKIDTIPYRSRVFPYLIAK